MDLSLLGESVIYSDCWKANDGMVDCGAKENFRVKHSKSEFANDKFHINAIANVFAVVFGVMQTKKVSLKAKKR